jgi:undecaprenyl pyrophosphate phosphatase UppP
MLTSLIASLASGETVVALKRARRAAVVYLVSGLLVLIGAGFLLGALFAWTAQRYGTIEAAILFGVVFIALALVILVVHRLTARSRATKAAERRKSDLTALGVATVLAVLPGLLRGRAGIGALLAPAIAAAAYAIYRENKKPQRGPDRPPPGHL